MLYVQMISIYHTCYE